MLRYALLLLCLALICAGCETKETPNATTTIAPPPTADGAAPPPVATLSGSTPSSGAAPVATTPSTTPSTTPGPASPPVNFTPVTTVAAEGAVAANAKALAIVQPDHFAVLKFDMAAMRNSPFLKSLPFDPQQMARGLPVPGAPGEEAAAEMAKGLEQVNQLWVSLGPPGENDGMPVSLAVYASCTSPQAAADALKSLQADPANAETIAHAGTTYFRSKDPSGPIWTIQGSDVYMSSNEATVLNAIAAQGKVADAELLKKLAAAQLDAPLVVAGSFGPFKEMMSLMAVGALKESPIPLSPELGNLPKQIDFAVISVNPDAEALLDIDADLNAEQSAENMKTSLEGIISFTNILLGQQAAAAVQANDVDTQQAIGIARKALASVEVTRDAQHIDAKLKRFDELAELPKLMTAQLERAKTMMLMNNARQIGLAAFNHRDATRAWPTDAKGPDGTPLLSWRYALLPYLEESALYQRINNQETWNSTANQPFAEQMPKVFETPSATEPNTTSWKLLDEHASGILFLDTGKGTAAPWLRADNFDTVNVEASLGEEPEGGFVIVNSDGSVQRLPRAELVAKLTGKPITPTDDPAAGGQPAAEGPLAGQEERFWQPATGRAKIKAVLIDVKEGKALLRRTDTNREFIVPLEKLSKPDQEYIRSLNLPNN